MAHLRTTRFDYEGLPAAFVKASKARAEKIASLDRQTAQTLIETGRVLKEQREAFGSLVKDRKGHRGADTWSAWVQQEIGWKSGRDAANRYIQIYEAFGHVDDTSTSNLGFEKMKLLSTRSTPPELREKVVKMAAKGEAPTHLEIEQMKRDAANVDALTPTEAKKKAQETGQVVVGSDQRIYTPLDENETAEYMARRDRTYEIIDATVFLGNIGISAREAIEAAEDHWLKDLNINDIEASASFLDALAVAFKTHKGIIDHGE